MNEGPARVQYDWSGVLYKCAQRYGLVLRDPPKYQLRGIRAYQQFRTVFFLDTIMRTSTSDDDAEAEKLIELLQGLPAARA